MVKDYNLNIRLRDMGDCFYLYDDYDRIPIYFDIANDDKTRKILIPYGEFARAISEMNHIEYWNAATSFFDSESKEHTVLDISKSLYDKFINKAADTSAYSKTMIELLVRDIANEYLYHINSNDYTRECPYPFIPSDKININEAINNISNGQCYDIAAIDEYFKDLTNPNHRIMPDVYMESDDGILTICYMPRNTYDILLLDLNKLLTKQFHMVKWCESCGHLFVPSRTSDKYCQVVGRSSSNKTCGQYMRISPLNEFLQLRNKARNAQFKYIDKYKKSRKIDSEYADKRYADWSKECSKHMKEYEALGDIDGFRRWIESKKFSKDSDFIEHIKEAQP